MSTLEVDGQALKSRLGAGVERVSRHVEQINRLNVFPVPDGDTGVNMFHTLRRAYHEIASEDSERAGKIAADFAYGALMGARGNSGTILSQLLAGFADGLSGAPRLTPRLLRAACGTAVERAYAAVSQPTEGTILTVAREAAERLRRQDAADLPLEGMLETLIDAAQTSLENTPELLPILKDAGVVDAGGMGLVCFLQGLACAGAEARDLPSRRGEIALQPAAETDAFGYDVQFLMLGERFDLAKIRRDLDAMGWSLIAVGDERMIKVHIHVSNPALPLDYAARLGAELDDVVVENMTLQSRRAALERASLSRPAVDDPPPIAVIAVAEGDGLQAVFRDLNCAAVIPGGASRNPATEDFIHAIERLPAPQAIILPNHPNVILAARQAADFVQDKRAHVLPTQTAQQGISAMLAFGDAVDGEADAPEIVERMRAACARTRSIAVARASRDSRIGALDIRQADYIALVDGEIRAASPDLDEALLDAFACLDGDTLELAAVYYGEDMPAPAADQLIQRLRKRLAGLEFECVYGGQPLYPLLISVE